MEGNNENSLINLKVGLSCNLTAGQKDRIDFNRNKVISSYEKYEEIENGYSFIYDNSEDMAHALLDFIIKEQSCCSFIDFNLGFSVASAKIECKVTSSTHNVNELKKFLRQMYLLAEN